MPVDPSIALQTQSPPGPLDQYAKVMALRNLLGQGQLQQQQIQEGQIDLEAKRRDFTGQQALSDAIQKNMTQGPDGTPVINHAGVTQALGASGQGRLIPGYMTGVLAQQKAQADAKKLQLENATSSLDLASRQFEAASDQNSWDAAIATAHGLGIDTAKQGIPDVFSPAAKVTVQALGMTVKEKLAAQSAALDAQARKQTADTGATKEQAELPKQQADSAQAVRANLAAQLGATTSQAEYQKILNAAPFEVAREFDGKTPEQARKLGMSAEQQTQAGETGRHNAVEETQGAARIGVANAELGLSRSKEAREQQIYDQTYGPGANQALIGVPPNLRTAATAAAQKAADEYNKAGAAQRDMQTFLDAAKAGNKEAYAYLSPEGVLTLNTGRGVTRVNRQEIDAYAGAGSLFDQIAGKAGKLIAGKSVPDDVLKDIENLHQKISGNSTATYNQKLASINQNYRANFKPVDAAAAWNPPAGAKIQHNPQTGKERYSTDGGKTWVVQP